MKAIAEERNVLPRTSLAALAASFLLIGVAASVYGPLLPVLSHRFSISLPVAGQVFSAHFAGALLGVVGSMRVMSRLRNRDILAVALVVLAVGCALAALAPSWPLMLGAIFVVGAGFGIIDIGPNQIVAHSEGSNRTSVINTINGTFGVGAVLGPILVATLGEPRYQWIYVAVAILTLALLPAALRTPGRLPALTAAGTRRPVGLVLIFVIAFALYVGTEAGIGGWSTSHLESVGLGTAAAATVTSGFWLALGVGRMLAALIPSRISERAIVTTASALAVVAVLAAVSGRAAPFAYVVAGLALAPIFPTGLVWLAKLLPGDASATSWLFPGAMVGGAIIPAGIGLVIAQVGVGAAPVALSGVALAAFLAFAVAGIVSKRALATARSL